MINLDVVVARYHMAVTFRYNVMLVLQVPLMTRHFAIQCSAINVRGTCIPGGRVLIADCIGLMPRTRTTNL